LSFLNPRLMSYSQYGFTDPPSGQWGDGLETDKGKKKPEYDAYVVPFFMPTTQASHATTLTVWAGVRPAFTLSSPGLHQQATIEVKPAGSGSAGSGGSGGGKALATGESGSGASGSGSGTKGSKTDGGYTVLQTVKITNKRGYFKVKQAFTRSGTV